MKPRGTATSNADDTARPKRPVQTDKAAVHATR
jgi:hypothetical protein